jgi:hypothetical protein
MKQLILLFSLYLIAGCGPSIKKNAGDIQSEGDADGRTAYEIKRLADPATGKIPLYIRTLELEYASGLPNDNQNSFLRGMVTTAWQQRGPWNVGGRSRALAVDISNPSVLIAGSASGGMWRSADNGSTWTRTSLLSQNQSVTCVTQDVRPGHQNIWYYATGEAYGQSASADGAYYVGNGVYKSIDSAKTWSPLPVTIGASSTAFDIWSDVTWNIAIDPSDLVNDKIYIASYGGIYKSLNGGNTWALMKGNIISASVLSYFTDVEVTSTGVIYCTLSSDGPAASKGIWRSVDGINFTNITPASFAPTYNRIKIGISPSDENQLYILGNTPGYGQPDTNFLGDVEWNSLYKYWYLSGNGSGTGGQWLDLSANLPTTGGLFDKYQSQGSYDIAVKVKPDDTSVVYIGGTNLYRSLNGFKNDLQTTHIGGYLEGATLPVVENYADHHPDQHEIVFSPGNPLIMYSANDGGLYITNDDLAGTVVWNSLNNGYTTTQFYTCAIDHASTNNIIIGGAQDNGTWYTNTQNSLTPWIQPRGGDGSYCAIADNEAAYYFSIQNGKMMKAKVDANGNIDSFARIDPLGGANYQFINPYILDPNNNNIMYLAGGRNLWRNDNLSGIPYLQNWDSITTNWTMFPDTTVNSATKISAVAVSHVPANRVYYGTDSRRVYRIDNANSGIPSRMEITALTGTAIFPASGSVSCIAVDPSNADNLIVAFSNYNIYSLFYSTDGGTTWSKIGGNLEANSAGTGNGPSIRWVSIMPVTGGTIYWVGASTGLYATSTLNGLSTVWIQQATSSIGNMVCDMIDYRATDGLVTVATHGNGIFSANITGINDIVSVNETVQNLSFNCYPNPAVDNLNVTVNLQSKGRMSLKLFDQNGKIIYRKADEDLLPGDHQWTIPLQNINPGIYFMQVNDKLNSDVKKITVL